MESKPPNTEESVKPQKKRAFQCPVNAAAQLLRKSKALSLEDENREISPFFLGAEPVWLSVVCRPKTTSLCSTMFHLYLT